MSPPSGVRGKCGDFSNNRNSDSRTGIGKRHSSTAVSFVIRKSEDTMVASVIHGDETVVCIHDDYCRYIKAEEIAHILLKISNLVSNAYRGTKQTQEKY